MRQAETLETTKLKMVVVLPVRLALEPAALALDAAIHRSFYKPLEKKSRGMLQRMAIATRLRAAPTKKGLGGLDLCHVLGRVRV